MDLYLVRDYIGLYAPVILFMVTLLLLRNMQNLKVKKVANTMKPN